VAWAALKAALVKDLGGPSLLPTRIWGVRRAFTITLAALLVALAADQAWLRHPVAMQRPAPSPSPSPAPHFALDDVDLGPRVQLTRFYPSGDLFDGYAIEAGDGRFYVDYGRTLSPAQWDMEGPPPMELAMLSGGLVTAIRFSSIDSKAGVGDVSEDLEGLWHGMPVVHVHDGAAVAERWIAIGSAGMTTFARRPPSTKWTWPCVDFGGGRVCQVMSGRRWAVSISLPGRDRVSLGGAPYVMGPPYEGRPDMGEIKLVGGGPHNFLLVEYHQGQDAAECLEGHTR
jgi:hypothetical protein